jgi:NADPH:quinone reductase-like Zn-dependent oxidoreductase
MSTMQAVVYEQYGPPEVLKLSQVAKPTPKPNEVLIKIYSTTVTVGDWRLRKANPFLARFFTGLFKPKNPILGHELAGIIETVGTSVTRYKVGDAVFASTKLDSGSYAEYMCLPEDGAMALKPNNLSFEEAATIPIGGLTAIHLLREAGIKAGQKVLVYGASGSVGSFAVQLAKHFGTTVTAVCSITNVELVKSLGADTVIDYKKTDVTQSNEQFDLIFDAVGYLPFAQCKNILKPNGTYASVSWGITLTLNMIASKIFGGPKVVMGMSAEGTTDIVLLKKLAEAGKLKGIIDRCYTLADLPEAHHYVESGRKKGGVVIQVAA